MDGFEGQVNVVNYVYMLIKPFSYAFNEELFISYCKALIAFEKKVEYSV